MKRTAAPLSVLAGIALCGCVDVDTRISLARDGHGTVETTAALGPMLALMMQLGAHAAPGPAPETPDLCAQLAAPIAHDGLTVTHSVPAGLAPASACTRTVTTTDWRRDIEKLFAGTLIEVEDLDERGHARIAFDAAGAVERITSDPDSICAGASIADAARCRAEAQRIAQAFSELPRTLAGLHDILGPQALAPAYRLTIEGEVRGLHGFTPRPADDGTHRAVFEARCAPTTDPGCAGMLRSIRWAFATATTP